MRGRSTSARAIATRWRWPPESAPGSARPSRPTARLGQHPIHAVAAAAPGETSPCAASGRPRCRAPPPWIERGERVLEHRLDQPCALSPIHRRQPLRLHQDSPRWVAADPGSVAPASICRSRTCRRCPARRRPAAEGNAVDRAHDTFRREHPPRLTNTRRTLRSSIGGVAPTTRRCAACFRYVPAAVTPPCPSRRPDGTGRLPAAMCRRGTACAHTAHRMGAAIAKRAASEAGRDARHDAGMLPSGSSRRTCCRARGCRAAARVYTDVLAPRTALRPARFPRSHPHTSPNAVAMRATMPRSWVISSSASPSSRCNLCSRRRICACTVTSSAVVGSSAISSPARTSAPSRSSPADAARRRARCGYCSSRIPAR